MGTLFIISCIMVSQSTIMVLPPDTLTSKPDRHCIPFWCSLRCGYQRAEKWEDGPSRHNSRPVDHTKVRPWRALISMLLYTNYFIFVAYDHHKHLYGLVHSPMYYWQYRGRASLLKCCISTDSIATPILKPRIARMSNCNSVFHLRDCCCAEDVLISNQCISRRRQRKEISYGQHMLAWLAVLHHIMKSSSR